MLPRGKKEKVFCFDRFTRFENIWSSSEMGRKKEEKKTLSSKCFLIVGRISTSWEIVKKFEHTCRLSTCRFHKFRRLIAFLRMKTAADPRRHRAQPAAPNAKLCPNLITTALNEFNRQPAQLDVWVSRRYDDEARGCGHESTTTTMSEQTLPFHDDVHFS